MRLVLASGKGGTGKTSIATSLAVVAAEAGVCATYVDCDVEEPNGHLLLRPELRESADVEVPVPVVDVEACTRCGVCAAECQFNALASLPDGIVTFPQLCHGCGACSLVCPVDAIHEEYRKIGSVAAGSAGSLAFLGGTLNVGEATGVPVVRALKSRTRFDGLYVLDAPPGTGCAAVEVMRDADVLLLVTEPTPFGLHDLRLAVAASRELRASASVIINRADVGDDRVREFCSSEGLRVAAEIPNSIEVARAYAAGDVPLSADPSFRSAICRLYDDAAAFAGSRDS